MPSLSSFAIQTVPLTGNSPEAKRTEIKHTLIDTWQTYESLFSLINNDDAYYLKPEPLRHPLIFYYAHTAVFYINKLKLAKQQAEGIDPHLEAICAVGVDEMAWDDLDETHYDWPSVQRVKQYRDHVLSHLLEVLASLPLTLPIKPSDPAWLFLMGIEHERIHLETSSVLLRQLPLHHLTPTPEWHCPCHSDFSPINRLQSVPQQTLTLGKSLHSDTYGWDNEYGQYPITVPEFEAAQYLVSNGEFLAFVEDDGYQNSEYWTEEGNRWRIGNQARHPRFWLSTPDGYCQRNLLEIVPLPLNFPVEINQLEAHAFCQWLSEKTQRPFRLPTEAEWYALQQHTHAKGGNRGLKHAGSCAVNQEEHGEFFDVIGNVWQWTQTPIMGFEGFEVHPLYDDFSTPTFDGQHNVIKGGSWISTGNELQLSSRYAFRRHFYQHAGFRYVCGEPPIESSANPYETDALISQYLDFHYGENRFNLENFAVLTVKIVKMQLMQHHFHRVLDIGCAVGRSSFEWAQYADHVDGIDFSARFIQHANALLNSGQTHYAKRLEGELTQAKQITLGHHYCVSTLGELHFSQGDATNLKPQFAHYDLIFASNLLDRLAQPASFLTHIAERLNAHGHLVLISPYTWLEKYTEKTQWLGGIKRHGETLTTFEALVECLSPQFDLIHREDVPFVIAETARKHQFTFSELTIWKKRS